MFDFLTLERRDRIALITIQRPSKLNALNRRTRQELIDVLAQLRPDADLRVVVITGAGEKAFVAGADISEFANRSPLEQYEVMKAIPGFVTLEEFPRPIIAMVNGLCLGEGCELALACDLRVASDRATFGQPEVNLGLIPGAGATQRLTRLIGEGRAMHLMLTGQSIDAAEALRIGLVSAVYPHGELLSKTWELAERIAEKSPVAVSLAKRAIKAAARTDLLTGLERELDLFGLCFSSDDRLEGVSAFLEKRKPNFPGH